jgi:hypothetical protein
VSEVRAVPINKTSIGKLFVSHSSVDKPFVRRLAKRLLADGYLVWLDEAELLPGDSLPAKVSEALGSSKVVLVIVSAAAIRSKWLSFELNKATERMIKGECRVIPIVIEKVKLPAEVQGLLYADFTISFKMGYQSVATALQYEAAKASQKMYFYARADAAVEEVFGKAASVSVGAAYTSQDYEALSLPYLNSDGDEFSIVYESVPDYMGRKEPLPEVWAAEFAAAKEQYYEDIFLIVSERPIGFKCDETSTSSERVLVKRMSKSDWNKKLIVVVDLSGIGMETWKEHLDAAKAYIVDYARSKGILFDIDSEQNGS